jgi:hypothetical protein
MAAVTIKNPIGRRQMVDGLVDAHLDWRHDCVLLQGAYSAWAHASAADAALTFKGYQAAMDREECTANAYAVLVLSFGDLVDTNLARQLAELPTGLAVG